MISTTIFCIVRSLRIHMKTNSSCSSFWFRSSSVVCLFCKSYNCCRSSWFAIWSVAAFSWLFLPAALWIGDLWQLFMWVIFSSVAAASLLWWSSFSICRIVNFPLDVISSCWWPSCVCATNLSSAAAWSNSCEFASTVLLFGWKAVFRWRWFADGF